jgi:hypothetical protein
MNVANGTGRLPSSVQGWFRISNHVIDRYGAELGPYGIALYCCIVREARSGVARVTQDYISRTVKMSDRQIRRMNDLLVTLGLAEVTSSTDGVTANVYRLTGVDYQSTVGVDYQSGRGGLTVRHMKTKDKTKDPPNPPKGGSERVSTKAKPLQQTPDGNDAPNARETLRQDSHKYPATWSALVDITGLNPGNLNHRRKLGRMEAHTKSFDPPLTEEEIRKVPAAMRARRMTDLAGTEEKPRFITVANFIDHAHQVRSPPPKKPTGDHDQIAREMQERRRKDDELDARLEREKRDRKAN